MIRIEILPARCGDCILVEYGDAPRRVLIDAGFKATYAESLGPRLARVAPRVELELLVVTHIDRDHIRGALPLLREAPAVVAPRDVWFNAKRHLSDGLGDADGDELADILDEAGLPWNAAAPFAGHAVKVADDGPLPRIRLEGGAVLTLLSPYQDALTKLDEEWGDVLGTWDDPEDGAPAPAPPTGDDVLGKRPPLPSVDEALVRELAGEPYKEDKTAANGSSIAFVFEHGGARVLFTGDAHPRVLLRSLERLSPGERLKLDAFKLSHHGSETNLSPELVEKVDCPRWLFSTDSSGYGHPHPEAIARILVQSGAKTLCFNAATPYTTVWDDDALKGAFDYETEYPQRSEDGFVLELP